MKKTFWYIKEEKGFTLVEVIISLAILGIIAVSIITIFSGSYSNIFSMGKRSKAMTDASRKMETLYTIPVAERNFDSLKEALQEVDAIYVEEEEALYQLPDEDTIRFTLKSRRFLENPSKENIGYVVTIVVFYQNGQRNITLNTFLRGGI